MKKILRSTFGTLVVAAFLVLTPPIYAKGGHGGHGGHGKHGKHFSSVSQRGGHAFSRGGSKFSRARSGKAYRSWGGRKWSGGYRAGRAWNGGYWGGRNWGGGYWNGGTGTAVTGVGTHIGAGVTLTRTGTTAIILTGTILRTGTSMTTAPYQDGDIFTPDPSVILFRRVTTL